MRWMVLAIALVCCLAPVDGLSAESPDGGVKTTPKSYDDAFEQTREVAQQNTVWLRGVVEESGPEGVGIAEPVETALNRLTGAIEEHKSVYKEYKEATREPDKEGPAKRNSKIKALAKKLKEITDKCKDLSNKFNLEFRKAAEAANRARQRYKLGKNLPGDLFASNTDQKSNPQPAPGAPGGGAAGNPLQGGVSDGQPGGPSGTSAPKTGDHVPGRREGGVSDGDGPARNSGGETGTGDSAKRPLTPLEPILAGPDGEPVKDPGVLQGGVEERVPKEEAPGPTKPDKRKLIPLEPILAGPDGEPVKDPGVLKGGVEERVPKEEAPGPTKPEKRKLIPLEPILAGPDGEPVKDPGVLQGGVEERVPKEEAPKSVKRKLIPLEPILAGPDGEPVKDPGVLKGHVEKEEVRKPPDKKEEPPVGPGPGQKDEGPDPTKRVKPDPVPDKKDDDPTEEDDGEKEKEKEPYLPKLTGQKDKRSVPGNPKKDKKSWEAGIEWELPEDMRPRGKKIKVGDNEITIFEGNAKAGIKRTNEGVELKGEVELTGVHQKGTVYKSRHAEATVQVDYFTAKGGVSAAIHKGPHGFEAKGGIGGEAKLFDVKGNAKWSLPFGNGWGVTFETQGSVGVGAGGSIEGEISTAHGFKYKGREGFGAGILQSVQFSIGIEPVHP